ncbi:class I SAM-dependent methyltransferase [uncultured Desulfosarcina sp.]|uniref:class I SAM-dependent methyltransferase n=1 Tax=uncultured Desulfosarcina sp. TaxID=218289 RepID=UPI0029C6699D|nr:class I SAM-dependent methyltransferase [uncultured Desulfosarcina sp.]
MTLDQTLIDSIKGFLDPEEGRGLFDIALEASRLGPCLEIGSYCGKSAVYLGSACRENGTILFSIDHHRGSEEQQPGEEYFDPALFDFKTFSMDTLPLFRRTLALAGLEETVVPIVSRSDIAARGWAAPLSLVFIDGGHAFDTARTDYDCWAGHILPGGYLLIHDIFENPEEGGQAPWEVYQLAVASGRFEELPRIRTLGVLKRNSDF